MLVAVWSFLLTSLLTSKSLPVPNSGLSSIYRQWPISCPYFLQNQRLGSHPWLQALQSPPECPLKSHTTALWLLPNTLITPERLAVTPFKQLVLLSLGSTSSNHTPTLLGSCSSLDMEMMSWRPLERYVHIGYVAHPTMSFILASPVHRHTHHTHSTPLQEESEEMNKLYRINFTLLGMINNKAEKSTHWRELMALGIWVMHHTLKKKACL